MLITFITKEKEPNVSLNREHSALSNTQIKTK